MASGRIAALIAAGAVVFAACGVDPVVTAQRADQLGFDPTVIDPVTPPATTDPASPTDPAPTSIPATPPIASPPTTVPKPTVSVPADPDAIDFGPNKPSKTYDQFLLAVMTDLEAWWSQQYPAIYGEQFEPLGGNVYAAYPSRPDDIPGCGTPSTSYQEVQQYVAFYCGVGDFLVYDDSDDGLLAQLANDYGPGTIGTVFAHEYGHAIQLRSGSLDRALATILTEQQSDCFAGAWTGRVARGESPTVRYSDGDVTAGLIAMTKVSDPVGTDQFAEGGHGSGFDRVGAFQVGFTEGAERCAEILDAPLPLVPNQFTSYDDENSGGNAPFGYTDDDLLGFLPKDLNLYWDQQLADEIPALGPLELAVVGSSDGVNCTDLRGNLERGTAWCATTGEVFVNEQAALDLYRSLGDFSVGYLLGSAWSEAVQTALGSDLRGEARELVNDCLTGGWVQTVILVDTPNGLDLPRPRAEGRTSTVSAGDLDEAIQALLLMADPGNDDNVVGSAFEKIAALRTGVIDGTNACLAKL
jgi:predicted metalloprotease